jgi:hypothetical protein
MHPFPVRAMRRVRSAVLLELGIIHRMGTFVLGGTTCHFLAVLLFLLPKAS